MHGHPGTFRNAFAPLGYDDKTVSPSDSAEPRLGKGSDGLHLIITQTSHRANLRHSDRRHDLAHGRHLAHAKGKGRIAAGEASDRPAGEELVGPEACHRSAGEKK